LATQARDISFDRIAILVLATEWIVFGSMHFTMIDETARMIPGHFEGDFGRFWETAKHHASVITGILEVAAGVLILVPGWTQRAARLSIGLLILLSPAMYHILSEPAALGEGPGQTAFRIILLPNNIFLAICSVHLWRHPDAILARPAAAAAVRAPRQRKRRSGPVTLILPGLLLMANIAGFLALTVEATGHFGVACMWAMACIAAGALIGFLFGVPRANPAAAQSGQFSHNTNVEAVSDWLTKILVGVGLVNFQAIGAFTDRLAAGLSAATATSQSFATGLIVYFFVVGIIQGYLLTRMFLPEQFGLTE
jgi:uncharacterized membrane protein